MGDIIHEFLVIKPTVFVERQVDDIETQKLYFRHAADSFMSTEGGESINISGRDENGNRIEIVLPISVRNLREVIDRHLKGR